MDYGDAVAYMSGLLRFGWKLGNERFEALCERLGHPERRFRVIHVAGTKGKGSTTALAAAILREQGYRTGAYFSPYVYTLRERVQVDGALIGAHDLARIITSIRPHIEAVAGTELGQTTEFELKTALAFVYFAECGVDFACVEVGIGGRLDATNVVQPATTVITNIGLDHTEILGDTHALIAVEKAGIIKPGVACFTATDNAEALAEIERIALERGAPLTLVRSGPADEPTGDVGIVRFSACIEDGRSGDIRPSHASAECGVATAPTAMSRRFSIATPAAAYKGLRMAMAGAYQEANAACAVAAVESALHSAGQPLQQPAVAQGLAQTSLPGRFENLQLPGGPLVILDGAHNGMAAEALRETLLSLLGSRPAGTLHLVIGMVGGHSPEQVLDALAPLATRIYACRPDWKRGVEASVIAEAAARYAAPADAYSSVSDAVRAALAAAVAGDVVLITGSFYTVGEAPTELVKGWWKARLIS